MKNSSFQPILLCGEWISCIEKLIISIFTLFKKSYSWSIRSKTNCSSLKADLNKNFFHSKLLFFAEEEPESFDMCSPDGVKTSRFGKKCREDHMCDFHNQKYTWCYINFLDGPDWDYCSQCVDFRREGQNGQNQQVFIWRGGRWRKIFRTDK